MTKPSSPQTEIVPRQPGGPPAVDMDAMMTTIRSRTAGTVVVIEGPGTGQALPVYEGSNSIGRDPARNVVALDFGDTMIHREPHAYLTCSGGSFTLAASDQPNPVRLNGRLLAGTEPVRPGDIIALGKTSLRLDRP